MAYRRRAKPGSLLGRRGGAGLSGHARSYRTTEDHARGVDTFLTPVQALLAAVQPRGIRPARDLFKIRFISPEVMRMAGTAAAKGTSRGCRNQPQLSTAPLPRPWKDPIQFF